MQAAYAVLGDKDQRRAYDRGGAVAPVLEPLEATVSFQGFDFSAPAEGRSPGTFSELFADVFHDAARRATAADRGLEIDVHLSLSFEHAIRGGLFPISVARHDRCPACAGDGRTRRAPLAVSAVRRSGHAPLGAWPHGVLEVVRTLRRKRAG